MKTSKRALAVSAVIAVLVIPWLWHPNKWEKHEEIP